MMLTMTMSELRQKKSAFSARVSKGPVLITKRGKMVAEVFTDASAADIDFDIPRDNDRKGLREVKF